MLCTQLGGGDVGSVLVLGDAEYDEGIILGNLTLEALSIGMYDGLGECTRNCA